MFVRLRETLRTRRLVRNAIDTYPGGLCLASADGRPILVNVRINELCDELLGHAIVNVQDTWEELEGLFRRHPLQDVPELDGAQLLFELVDGSLWSFGRQQIEIGERHLLQIEAADVTELVRSERRLALENRLVAEMHEHQRGLVGRIEENALVDETLRAKMRIHDEFGRCLIMTQAVLSGEKTVGEPDCDLFEAWDEAIRDMENTVDAPSSTAPSPKDELVRVADMIGCEIEFVGKQPRERPALLLMYAAIREALTNAVSHAGADRLKVETEEGVDSYRVSISCNGRKGFISLKERDGLGGLRRRVEGSGGAMKVICDGRVTLVVYLPREGRP